MPYGHDRGASAVSSVKQRRSVSKYGVAQTLWCRVGLVLALVSGGCQQARESAVSPITTRMPPPCQIDAPFACRVGCDADVPKQVLKVAPDLSGIELASLHGLEIAEILIDGHGDVKDVCLRRGVREDVDARAVTAIRQWRYEPVRLHHSTPPGMVVSAVVTVTLPIGQQTVTSVSSPHALIRFSRER
jgi:hypothetical protein